MKQKLIVRALIKENDKVLLVRRATGDETMLGLFELPGGRLEDKEQPTETLARELRETLDVAPETMQLKDLFTHGANTSEGQHFVAIYTTSLAPTDRAIRLGNHHDKYVWKQISDIKISDVTESTRYTLGLEENILTGEKQPADKISTGKVIVYSDGGSRGNPGPSAAGFVVMDTSEATLFEGGKYLGVTTNNQAEYQAVCLGLEKAHEMGAKVVDFRLDSLLVVNQLNGIYQIKNHELWPIYSRIKDLCEVFDKVTFKHVRREFNKLADGMVNKILDEHANQRLV